MEARLLALRKANLAYLKKSILADSQIKSDIDIMREWALKFSENPNIKNDEIIKKMVDLYYKIQNDYFEAGELVSKCDV